MISYKGIDKDFKSIIIEVTKQLKETLSFVEVPEEKLIEQISNRDDYIDNLKSKIEDKCFYSLLHQSDDKADRLNNINLARAINIISNNLERIADYAVNIVRQTQYLKNALLLADYEHTLLFNEIVISLELINSALFNKDLSLALKICCSEDKLDKLYKEKFDRILFEIKEGKHLEDCITLLLIFSYLERMGDALLNIGEAIIFTALGQKLKIYQFKALEESLTLKDFPSSIDKISFESIWESRSGCRIGKVRKIGDTESAQGVIFKEGNKNKVLKEKKHIEQWNQIIQGLAPKVLSFQENQDHASMLIEYLGNKTFQHIILNESDEILADVIGLIQQTVESIWTQTKKEYPVNAGYFSQLSKRIHDVLSLYPGFKTVEKQIGRRVVSSFEERIKSLEDIENTLNAPFSVFIHGDFNIDNIIYTPDDKLQKIHFIDLYRSAQSDYIQDVSVFLVSNFRLPFFSSPLRKRLYEIMESFYSYFVQFASKQSDTTFGARLTLGIIRSLITSTRFEFNQNFAQEMYYRAVYLLEKLVDHKGLSWESFEFPEVILEY